MAFSRKKPAPTRRGRVRTETKTTEEEVVVEAPAEPEAEPTVERTVVRRTVVSSGGGLEMALIVVTLVTLIAAFVLLQLEMRKAFGEGWPV